LVLSRYLKTDPCKGGYFRRKNQGFDNKQIHIRQAQEVTKPSDTLHGINFFVASQSPYPLVMARKGRT
jgi:hypothetical protein